jgi:hypothetical protein
MSSQRRIDRKVITDLRMKLVLARVNKPAHQAEFLGDLDSYAGELMALADFALTIREAYVRKRAEGALVPNVSRVVAYAMASFEQLEETAAAIESQDPVSLADELTDRAQASQALLDKLRHHPDCTYQDSDSVIMRDTPSAREVTREVRRQLDELPSPLDMHGFKVRSGG